MKDKRREKELIQEPWLSPMIAMRLAVTKIQALGRGICVRHDFSPGSTKKKRSQLLDKYLGAASTGGYSEYCATRLQAWFRMVKVPKKKWKFAVYEIAALEIQSIWKEYCRNSYYCQGIEESAARTIQGTWRRYTNIRVYSYYRDLIRFSLGQGDAAQLLRTINPMEASMIDKSASIHLRFRLGGSSFPPTLYYKLFTRQAVCDLGLFAPRADYTTQRKKSVKAIKAEQGRAHIRVGKSYFGVRLDDAKPDHNWYQRQDNNPWRPVAVHSLSSEEEKEGAQPKSLPSVQSRRALLRKRKLQKRRCLQDLYLQHKASEEPPSPLLNDLILLEADQLYRAEAKQSEDTVVAPLSKSLQPNNEDDLLAWSKNLDYEDYIAEWSSLATSGPARRSSSSVLF